METAHITFPSGRTADLAVCDDAADLAWVINLGCIDLNPWPVRDADVDHPDELRVDLDPTPEATFAHVREVALCVRDVLRDCGYPRLPEDLRLARHPHQRANRAEVGVPRGAALRRSRSAARSSGAIPALATTKWWKEERHGVFIDYNQNARDRTVASAYSVRPMPDARVSCPLEWDEVPDVDPALFTIETVPARFAERGDPHESIDDAHHSLEPLLELVRKQEEARAGRRAVAAAVPEGAGRAAARAAEQAQEGVAAVRASAGRAGCPIGQRSGEARTAPSRGSGRTCIPAAACPDASGEMWRRGESARPAGDRT